MLRAVATQKAPVLLAASAVAASVTGTTTRTTLATVTVPGGTMGANGGVEIRTTWSTTSSANNKTLRAEFGGSAVLGSSVTTSSSVSDVRRVRNRNATNSQVCSWSANIGGFGSSSAAVVTTAIDTAADVSIVISGQLANTGETITLESYEVWLLP